MLKKQLMILIAGVGCLLIVSCKSVSKDTDSVVNDSAVTTPRQVLPEEAPVVKVAEPEPDTVSEKKEESVAAQWKRRRNLRPWQ